MSLLANSNAIETGGYNIDRSLRFRSSASAYLNKTFSGAPTSTTTQTFSWWVKLGEINPSANRMNGIYGSNGSTEGGFSYRNSGDLYPSAFKWELNNGNNYITTTQVFRDPSAWYHIVAVYDTSNATASNRLKLYINGQQVTSFIEAVYPSQNFASPLLSNGGASNIGKYTGASNYADCYIAEFNAIDGQALTPSSFGETATETGVWVPKKYTGTYGTNGFYLNFSDNTSATTLAYDKSGNGNNWTANNISTTAGSTYDSMLDVPTLTSATAANFATFNPLNKGDNTTIVDANLKVTLGASSQGRTAVGSISMKTGKWYWEVTGLSNITADRAYVGITADYANINGSVVLGFDSYSYTYNLLGDKGNNSTFSAYGATWTNNDVIGVALNMDNGELTFYKNGVSQGVAYTVNTSIGYVAAVAGTSATQPTYVINFGQRPFSYTPPTGFKALNTFNLPDPTIKKPNQYMDATLYTGTGSDRSVTNAGGFQPDLVMLKCRSNVQDNPVFDSSRGVLKEIYTDLTNDESTETIGLSAFNSNGFSLTSVRWNNSGYTFVGWQWKESATAGFDIVTYTGTGSARTISHNLGVAPSMMIVKRRDSSASGWIVYHKYSRSDSYDTFMVLNSTDAVNYEPTAWNSTTPTSSVFSLGTYAGTNANTGTFVNYLFAEIPGFSKFGSYTGNGSTDGPFVYCGFRPKYVLIKRTDASGQDWILWDAARPNEYNTTYVLYPNSSAVEDTAGNIGDFVSNGFKPRTTGLACNASGSTYIYAAFAESPFKYSLGR